MSLKQAKLRRSDPAVEGVPSYGPGPRLRDARLARSLDLDQAAEMLKLDARVLAALEQDDYAELPQSLYVRGYLSGYARLLCIPESEVLAEYRAFAGDSRAPELAIERSVRPQVRSSDTLVRWFSFLVIAGITSLVAWWSYDRLRDPGPEPESIEAAAIDAGPLPDINTSNTSPTASLAAPEAKPAKPAKLAAERTAEEPPAVAEAQDTVAGQDAAAAQEGGQPSSESGRDVPVLEPGQPGTSAPTPEVVVEPAAAGVDASTPVTGTVQSTVAPSTDPTTTTLELAFARDCWLEVRGADGDRLAYGLAKAGSSRTLAGTPPFRVTVGDSGAVTIRLDGKLVAGASYGARNGQPARFSLGGEAGG